MGSKISTFSISKLNKKADVNIEDWRNRTLQGGRVSVCLCGWNPPALQMGQRV